MMQSDEQGLGYVRKETGWLTNSCCLPEVLRLECPNKGGGPGAPPEGWSKAAPVWPPALCRAMLR
eukprot:12901998-Prorocentrum_lima.AAC.1